MEVGLDVYAYIVCVSNQFALIVGLFKCTVKVQLPFVHIHVGIAGISIHMYNVLVNLR